MRYNNPIDKELVLACEEAYTLLSRVQELLEVPTDNRTAVTRLRDALYSARTEMQLHEEMEIQELTSTTKPPSSND